MWGGGNQNSGGPVERITDELIDRFVPGGENSALGERLDNMIGGNPNPTYGQMHNHSGAEQGYNQGSGYGGGPPDRNMGQAEGKPSPGQRGDAAQLRQYNDNNNRTKLTKDEHNKCNEIIHHPSLKHTPKYDGFLDATKQKHQAFK
ncbi:unnamed protein product [Didymodactylos carnosus]|uniref:Uncharacterized protein n=1 Tax=Didymodactylos carnosus TaxID=1234261 RepID=A0A814RA51_9BILA|nr:unnamed protein product [Didymodactylos carnosus]CAF1198524.1 unnamed protein product [Didymodactylos carnosus]CAF3894934.1 unnamed protein product [Didymodactylos carnosus]CAF4008637.1 unnamed protein product [Didymodactylos carnosus]